MPKLCPRIAPSLQSPLELLKLLWRNRISFERQSKAVPSHIVAVPLTEQVKINVSSGQAQMLFAILKPAHTEIKLHNDRYIIVRRQRFTNFGYAQPRKAWKCSILCPLVTKFPYPIFWSYGIIYHDAAICLTLNPSWSYHPSQPCVSPIICDHR